MTTDRSEVAAIEPTSEAPTLAELAPATQAELAEVLAELDVLRRSIAFSDRKAGEEREKLAAAERKVRVLEEYGSGVGADIVRMIEKAASVHSASISITSPATSSDRFSGADAPLTGWTVEATFHEPVRLAPLAWSEATTDDGTPS